jgi:hypothetical protein
MSGNIEASFHRGTLGFSEPEQVTQRKSKRLTEGFVCNPLLIGVFSGIKGDAKCLPSTGRIPFTVSGNDAIENITNNYAVDTQYIRCPLYRTILSNAT